MWQSHGIKEGNVTTETLQLSWAKPPLGPGSQPLHPLRRWSIMPSFIFSLTDPSLMHCDTLRAVPLVKAITKPSTQLPHPAAISLSLNCSQPNLSEVIYACFLHFSASISIHYKGPQLSSPFSMMAFFRITNDQLFCSIQQILYNPSLYSTFIFKTSNHSLSWDTSCLLVFFLYLKLSVLSVLGWLIGIFKHHWNSSRTCLVILNSTPWQFTPSHGFSYSFHTCDSQLFELQTHLLRLNISHVPPLASTLVAGRTQCCAPHCWERAARAPAGCSWVLPSGLTTFADFPL